MSRTPDPDPASHRRPDLDPKVSPDPSRDRPKSRAVEYENLRGDSGGPPRSATEPRGSEEAAREAPTAVDPSSGEPNETPDPRATTPPGRSGP